MLQVHTYRCHKFSFLLTKLRVVYATSCCRYLNSQTATKNLPVLHIPSASIFRFSTSQAAKPVLKLDWTINDGESWAIVGNSGDEKTSLLETLKGQTRIQPPPPNGIWPFLYEQDMDPVKHVRSVSFAHRPRTAGGGGFYDYSARYGAIREDDALSLRQSLLECVEPDEAEDAVVPLAGALELKHLLDLPFIALSNGQTRRARILKILLRRPQVLLLDEPMTGLDERHRHRLMHLLHMLHQMHAPRIIISLRVQDPVPDWITHIALVQPGGHVLTGEKTSVLTRVYRDVIGTKPAEVQKELRRPIPNSQGAVLVNLQGVNVAYHERHILKNINWTVREGERWILKGPNGSGKTTLLSMITGDHPQSYTQPHLFLFGMPRRRIPTPEIARRIGITSPELYNAFPRRSGPQGLTVQDTIVTGFEGIFTYRKPSGEQIARVDSLLQELGPIAWAENVGSTATENFQKLLFADLTPGEQSLVLLIRAMVNEPELLILDEALSGMDSRMVTVTKRYLRERSGAKQGIIWVSHWDSESPWGVNEGVRKYSLEDGLGIAS